MGIFLLLLAGINDEFVYEAIKMKNQWKRTEANFHTAFWMIIQALE